MLSLLYPVYFGACECDLADLPSLRILHCRRSSRLFRRALFFLSSCVFFQGGTRRRPGCWNFGRMGAFPQIDGGVPDAAGAAPEKGDPLAGQK